MSKQNILKKLYEDIGSPSAYSSANKLLKYAKLLDSNITKQDVNTFLKSQEGFTRHGLVPRTFMHRPIKIPAPGHTLGSDLIDMGNRLRDDNRGYRYILVLIDCFSRRIRLVPLTDKKNKTTASAIEDFLSETNHKYSYFLSDLGSEYKGRYTTALFKKYNLKQYSVYNSRTKCSIAERSIRSIKGKIYRHFTQQQTNNYIDILAALEKGYNQTQHRGLCNDTPNTVDGLIDKAKIKKQQSCQILQKYKNYGSFKRRNRDIKLSKAHLLAPGTPVRLLLNSAQSVFSKSYKPIFSEEIFKVDKVKQDIPITYYLTDLSGDRIKGSVYRSELKETTLPEYFVIEKILETKQIGKTKLIFVKWRGYPVKFNSWVKYDTVKKNEK